MRCWGHLRGRGAGAEGSPSSHPSPGGEDRGRRRGCRAPSSARAPQRKPALRSLAPLCSSENRSRLRQQDPKARKERKSEGRGRCGLQRPPSAPVGRQQRCYWRRGAERGRRGGGPASRLRRLLLHRRRGARGGSPPPRAPRPRAGAGCSLARLRALLAV